MANRLIDEFAVQYMESVYYYCLKKTEDSHEAEELASEITLHIVTALHSGTVPTHFHAWMWRIAHNRYSRWAAAKRRRTDTMMPDDVEEYDAADKSGDIFRDIEGSEELAILRRELAFIASDYREILVAYYFDDRRIKDIAASLSLPEGTVTSKLYRARHMLKEGMKMARTFGVKSYKPEEIHFTSSGTFHGPLPWSTLNHLLYKNIFLEVCGNPKTAKELALELGVSLPYMEDELALLVAQTFLIQNGDTYDTTFAIISREAQEAIYNYNRSVSKDLTDKLTALIDTWYAVCTAHGYAPFGQYQSYQDAKWTLLVMAFDHLLSTSVEQPPYLYTVRPDGGKWDIIGFQEADFKPLPFVGHHTASADANQPSDLVFGQFKFYHDQIHERTPCSISSQDAYTMQCVARHDTASCDRKALDRLLGYGYIVKTEAGYEPTIVVWATEDPPFTDEERAALAQKANAVRAVLADAVNTSNRIIKADLPASHRENEHLCDFACRNGGITREWVVEQAIADGWLTLDDTTSKVIGAHIRI